MPGRHFRQELQQLPWKQPQPHDGSRSEIKPARLSPEDVDRRQTGYIRLLTACGGAALVCAGVALTLGVQAVSNHFGAYPTPHDMSPLYDAFYTAYRFLGSFNHGDVAVRAMAVGWASWETWRAGQAAYKTMEACTTARHQQEVDAIARPIPLPASTGSEDPFADQIPITTYPEQELRSPYAGGYRSQTFPPSQP